MERKKFIAQIIAAFLLYVIISLILEKDYSKDIILREMTEGVVFAFVYGVVIWLSSKWRSGKKD